MNDLMYKMRLHDNINTNGVLITRVPGGWLYQKWVNYSNVDQHGNVQGDWGPPVFVPLNSEFMSPNDKINHRVG